MPVPSLSLVQQLIQASPLLASAISEGSIQVIYREPPVISADRLMATWTVDILLLDEAISDLVEKAVRRAGFTTTRTGEQIRAKRDWILTSEDRRQLLLKDEAAAAQRKEEQRDQISVQQQASVAELQAQVEALREELELLQLAPTRRGAPGPAGAPGQDGRDGRDGSDLLATSAKLSDLVDVSDEPANQGWVLTWSDVIDAWEPKPPRMGGMAMATGGGGLRFWKEDEDGNLTPTRANKEQSLGSQAEQLKEIWVSGGTVYLDEKPLDVNASGRLEWDGNVLAYGTGNTPADADGGTITLP